MILYYDGVDESEAGIVSFGLSGKAANEQV